MKNLIKESLLLVLGYFEQVKKYFEQVTKILYSSSINFPNFPSINFPENEKSY